MAQITYSPGMLFGYDVLTHEHDHIKLHMKPAYEDYKIQAEVLGEGGMSKPRANCIKKVMENELRFELVARSYFYGLLWDWDKYGKSQNDQLLWRMLQKAKSDYASAKAATLEAITSCE